MEVQISHYCQSFRFRFFEGERRLRAASLPSDIRPFDPTAEGSRHSWRGGCVSLRHYRTAKAEWNVLPGKRIKGALSSERRPSDAIESQVESSKLRVSLRHGLAYPLPGTWWMARQGVLVILIWTWPWFFVTRGPLSLTFSAFVFKLVSALIFNVCGIVTSVPRDIFSVTRGYQVVDC